MQQPVTPIRRAARFLLDKAVVLSGILAFLVALQPEWSLAAGGADANRLDLTHSSIGYLALLIFALSYLFVMAEEYTHLRKSKPVLLAAGLIWVLIAWEYMQRNVSAAVEAAARHNILEYAELFLFLLVAMTYINAMEERRVFEALRSWLVRSGFSFRQLFWLTGLLAFFISPIADNLTTALLMCAVVLAVGKENSAFVSLSCINIVVAANAGGAFSPFGDITTLMVWQKGIVEFWTFFLLFIPSVLNWLVPAVIMGWAVPAGKPSASTEVIAMKRGAKRVIFLFLLTIATAVSFHNFLHLPPMMGMMLGLAYLKFLGYYLKRTIHIEQSANKSADERVGDHEPIFDIFSHVARAEWDTLMFFYGVIMCVGGLGFMGYLQLTSHALYDGLGHTTANILVGLLSAVVDNIPVMFAILSMEPQQSIGQWLLVTMTAGVGGSLLSIGSAAGVALMGQARGKYTFFSHLKWSPAIALGYAVSIAAHFLINESSFSVYPRVAG
ncbi:MAG: sodium:proton antiporter NhaD [Magnetococcales bacterium]|nr:sodium:proton antiporter NhaD [Magnetococcales bacterium]MBF0116288.1 sodium:proton antiporter NhaD [Magnetococcales bacterium]